MQNGYGAQSREIVISAEQATTGTVEAPLQGWSQPFSVAANGTVTVTVPNTLEHSGSEIVEDKGIRITASDTINVYAASIQSYTGDGTSVLPLRALSTEYIISAAEGLPGFANFYKSEFVIVATEDGTEVVIVPSVQTAAGRPAGVPFTVQLNAGETYQVHADQAIDNLTGSIVRGNATSGECRPFAVFAGSMCGDIPTGCTACDHVFQQSIPTSNWGTTYYTFPLTGVNDYGYRVIARDANTDVFVDGVFLMNLAAGQWHDVYNVTQAHCITASNPISTTQLMMGYTCGGSGDPSILALNPTDQLITHTQFETLGSNQITARFVAVISDVATTNSILVDGAPIPAASFIPYPSCATHAYATVAIGPGQHSLDAPQGAIAYAYGIGTGESYLFSLGADAPTAPPMSDTTFCQSGPIDLIAPPGFSNTYWTPQNDPSDTVGYGQVYSFTPTSAGIFTAYGTVYESGCIRTQNYHIEMDAPANLNMSAVPSTLCQNGQSQLDAGIPATGSTLTINWSPGHLLNDSTIANPVATITSTTWFYVEVGSVTGCSQTIDSVLVEIAYPKVLDVELTASSDSICSGDQTQLSAQIEQEIIGDGFETSNPALWSSIQGGGSSIDCGAVQGQALYFNGAGTREAITNDFDLSNGGFVRFMLKIGTGVAPCDNADPGEDILVEYSTTGGATWSSWAGSTLDENSYPVFTQVELAVPPAAQSPNTSFRISQPSHSGAGEDNWAMDDLSISAYSSANLSVSWSPAASVATPSSATTMATPSVDTWYELTVQNNTTGCDRTDSIFISVGENFSLTTSGDTSICSAAPVALQTVPSGGAGHLYTWSPNNATLSATNIADPIATTTVTQTYTVDAVSDHGCTASDQVTITVGQLQGVNISASDSAICAGDNAILTANLIGGSGGVQYSWTPTGSLSASNVQSPTATPATTTVYSVSVTENSSGCVYTDNLQIDVIDLNLNAGPDTVICDPVGYVMNVQHTAPNPVFSWNGGVNLSDNNIMDPTVLLDSSYTYTVTLTDASGCSASDDITFTVPFDTATPMVDTAFCSGDSILLDATHPNSTYLWNGTDPSPAIWVTTGGIQNVELTDIGSGCVITHTFNVTMDPAPIVFLGNDTTICAGDVIVLDAQNTGSDYLWSTSEVSQTIDVMNPGTYWVQVTSSTGCTTVDSIDVIVSSLPVVSLSDTTLCEGNTILLDATNANSLHMWNTGANDPFIVVDTSGTYVVTVTNNNGCTTVDSAEVNFVPFPVVYLGPDTALCDGDPLLLDAGNPGMQHIWSTSANTQVISPSSTGIYWVDVANGSCVSRDSIGVVFNAMPTDNLTDFEGCVGDIATLDAGNPGATYLWSTIDSSATISVTNNGTYSVTVTTLQNCSDTFDATVTFETPPTIDLGNDTVLCSGQVLSLNTGLPQADNNWSNGAISSNIQVSTTDLYHVTVSTDHCVVEDSINVIFNPIPSEIIKEEILTCLDEKPHYVMIDAGNEGSSFNWASGETSQVILAGAYGWYFVNITNEFNCSIADSVVVSQYCPSSLWVPNSFTPNGDGVNDIFMAAGNNIVELEMHIFDRWGNEIFQSDDPSIGWDGSYRGSPVQDDVYVWKIRYRLLDEEDYSIEGPRQEEMGHVTVIR